MYYHVQRSPLHFLLILPVGFMFVLAYQIGNDSAPGLLVWSLALVFLLLALSFQTLTIADRGDDLDVRYGPLNLFGTRLKYRDMTDVAVGTSSWIDGWGIHFIPFRGWTINLWGFDCVRVERGKNVVRIGTDDVTALTEFLAQKMQSVAANQE